MELDDVQIECRSSEMLGIGQADLLFGPTCDRPTLPLSLQYFDLGSHAGLTEAMAWSDAQTWLCVCSDSKCPDSVVMKAMNRARKVLVEDDGKREREGVLHVTNTLASHSCLSAVIGAELYKSGFRCGFMSGLKSQLLTERRIKVFMDIERGDEMRARERAQACGDGRRGPLRAADETGG